MAVDDRGILWNQFILARALARTVRSVAASAGDEAAEFCYADTHAGSGRIQGPLPSLAAILSERNAFAAAPFFQAISLPLPGFAHPGSWVLAARVVAALGERVTLEVDANDIDEAVIAAARDHREGAWARFWSHDWFLFLRSRLKNAKPPHFVFIDPPPDDARGPAYGIDAAILLDTLAVPYLLTYPADSPQDSIDQIGRTGLELRLADRGFGVLLGGGAETATLDLLTDLRRLARLLGGEFAPRLPCEADYAI